MLVACLLVLFASLVSSQQTILDILTNNTGTYSTLIAATDTATRDLLNGATNYTLLAPNNNAWPTDTSGVSLPLHIIPGTVLSSALADELFIDTTLNNASFLRVFINTGDVTVVRFCSKNCAIVVTADTEAVNGVVHEIDTALEAAANNTITELVAATPALSTLLSLVTLADLGGALGNPSSLLTVFAPSNDAFTASLTEKQTACLVRPERVNALADILKYHVVAGNIYPSFQLATGTLETLYGDSDLLSVTVGTGVDVNSATVATADFFTNNGVAHVIDAVLVPAAYDAAWFTANCVSVDDLLGTTSTASSYAAQVTSQNLDVQLDDLSEDYTVFAPVDSAFSANTVIDADFYALDGLFPAASLTDERLITTFFTQNGASVNSFLRVHISGTTVYLCSGTCAAVTTADLEALNGLVHLLGSLITPAVNQTIADIATASADFNSLVASLIATELVALVDTPSASLTVFAPTDEAFAASLTADQINCLVNNKTADLADIIRYHVLPGFYPSLDITTATYATALTGESISVAVSNGAVVIDETATVVTVDIFAVNGAIHTIDRVLLPSKYTEQWFIDNCPSGAASLTYLMAMLLSILFAILF